MTTRQKSLKALAGKIGMPFLGEAPAHLAVRDASDNGAPLVAVAPKSPQAAPYLALAESIRTALSRSG